MVTDFGDKCDDGLNATKRGQGCCAFYDVFVYVMLWGLTRRAITLFGCKLV